jgi:hypothetical protein
MERESRKDNNIAERERVRNVMVCWGIENKMHRSNYIDFPSLGWASC